MHGLATIRQGLLNVPLTPFPVGAVHALDWSPARGE
jgi:hypothetical protein